MRRKATHGVRTSLGFPATQRSHLVGISDSTTAWLKEAQMRAGQGIRERGAVRAGSILPDRLRDAAAAQGCGEACGWAVDTLRCLLQVQNVSKMYRLYRRPVDRLLEMLPFTDKLLAHGILGAARRESDASSAAKCWASSGRTAAARARCCRSSAASWSRRAGRVITRGRIAALLELGAGFNPEFTGRENVFLNGEILGMPRREMERVFPAIERSPKSASSWIGRSRNIRAACMCGWRSPPRFTSIRKF